MRNFKAFTVSSVFVPNTFPAFQVVNWASVVPLSMSQINRAERGSAWSSEGVQ